MRKAGGPLRVCMFGHKRIPSCEGGVEVAVGELATRLARMGCDVTCLNRGGRRADGGRGVREYRGVRVRGVPTLDRRGVAAVTSSLSASVCAALGRYDVVHIHAEGPALFCWMPRLFGKRVFVTVHGLDHRRTKWGRLARRYLMCGERSAVRHADGIVVLSRSAQRYFREKYSRDTVFIPNGVNKAIIRPGDRIGERWGLEKDSYVLYLGRVVPEKGIHYLIEAFKGIETDKRLVIAGGSSDTDGYRRGLGELARGDGRILFTGFVQGRVKEELYSNAYVYCLPSDLEGMPLSLLEAMSYGNCCLVSDIPECTEVVGDRAAVFHRGDIRELRAKLQWLLDNGRQVREYRQSSAEYITAKYSWDDASRETLELYRASLAKGVRA